MLCSEIIYLAIFIVLIIVIILKDGKNLEIILNFLQPIIITMLILCSLIYLTKLSNIGTKITQVKKSNINDINISIIPNVNNINLVNYFIKKRLNEYEDYYK